MNIKGTSKNSETSVLDWKPTLHLPKTEAQTSESNRQVLKNKCIMNYMQKYNTGICKFESIAKQIQKRRNKQPSVTHQGEAQT